MEKKKIRVKIWHLPTHWEEEEFSDLEKRINESLSKLLINGKKEGWQAELLPCKSQRKHNPNRKIDIEIIGVCNQENAYILSSTIVMAVALIFPERKVEANVLLACSTGNFDSNMIGHSKRKE